MAIEAAGGAALAKYAAMFAASAFGAAIIAAYHADTRRETWWRALGAGIGGVPFGMVLCRYIGKEYSWVFTGSTLDDLGPIAAILFVIGSLFWGAVGLLQNVSKKLSAKSTADRIANKVGL